MINSVVIISDQSPVGKNSAIEALRLGSGFRGLGEEIDCQVVLMGDAVYLLSKRADPSKVGVDSFDEPMEMAELSDLEILVLDSAVEDAGLTKEDLIEYEGLKIINLEALTEIIDNADTIFRF